MSDEATIASVEMVDDARGSRAQWLTDLASSYALSIARVGSMAAIVALFYRYTDAVFVAALILCRTLAGIINYVFAGIGPATQRCLREVEVTTTAVAEPIAEARENFLSYSSAIATARALTTSAATVYASANLLALATAVASLFPLIWYANAFSHLHGLSYPNGWYMRDFVALYGTGLLSRLIFEPAGALLQTRGRLAIDNAILIGAEIAWPLLVWLQVREVHSPGTIFDGAAPRFLIVNLAAGLLRAGAAGLVLRGARASLLHVETGTVVMLCRRSLVASVGSSADFLYAPFNLVLINAALGAAAVAEYTPALQFDGALLLLVSAIAATMFPRAMSLASEGRGAALRTLYLRSTFASLAILATSAALTSLAAPFVVPLWLGRPMPVTLAILPLVLVHTVIGGTAGIGRAVLLGMGRFKAYTVSALVGGVANVLLALLFVVGFGWGLRGIVCATIVAVAGRCAIWMPWYILRALSAPAVAHNSGAPAR